MDLWCRAAILQFLGAPFMVCQLVIEREEMKFAMRAQIGPYEILSPLSAGGMGEVYRAQIGV